MPFRLNDRDFGVLDDKRDRTETPDAVPTDHDHVNTNTAQPTGPSNRVNFDFAKVGPGDPKYLTGPPLSELNAIPYRGAGMAGHALDTDVTMAEWNNHPSPADETGGGEAPLGFLSPPEPIVVSVVDMPMETEEKYSRIISLFGANEQYKFTAAGVFDTMPVRTILPKDDTRTSATIYAVPSAAQASGGGTAQYAFLISNDQQCLAGILLGTGVANAPQFVTLLGKSPVFARIVPLAAYDVTKTNAYTLAAVTESSRLGQKRIQ